MEGRIALRSFHETKAKLFLIRCTMQVCTTVCGNSEVIASGKPLKPSTTAIRMSLTPRAFSSLTTLSQNLAPCTCSIQRPSTLFSSGKTGLDRVDLLVSNALRVKIPDEGKNKPVVCC